MPLAISGDNPKDVFERVKKTSNFPANTYEVADSVVDSLLTSSYLVPSQWSGLFRRGIQSRELYLLWGIFISAWVDLASTKVRVREDAKIFFSNPDAGEPVSLRFLCDVFELDLSAVQAAAQGRIATGVRGNACQTDRLTRRRIIHGGDG